MFNEHFKQFADSLKREIAKNATDDSQKDQVEGLVQMETRWRRTLISHQSGRDMYGEFVKHIVEERRNILSARPFFRERQAIFSSKIAPALKARAKSRLYSFKINFQFISFVMQRYDGELNDDLGKQYDAIVAHRSGIIERNMPLAINRAKLFWNKVPKAGLEYMDLVQTAAEGLIAAVDKFVPPYTTVFRSVAIGRMSGNMVETYSDPMMHFYPSDKRELYRANITSYRKNLKDLGLVVEEMNRQRKEAWEELKLTNPDAPEPSYVTRDQMTSLMRAASHLSMDEKLGGEEAYTMYSRVADDGPTPGDIVEEMDSYSKLHEAVSSLNTLESKVLLLKGVSTSPTEV